MKLIQVTWVDSCTSPQAGWSERAQAERLKPERIRSVGYLIAVRSKSITIAAHVSPGGCVGGVMCIPRVAILKVRKL